MRRGPLQAVVKARGELEAISAYPVAVPPVPTGALKVAKLADEGSVVKKGDVIVVFDATQLSIELDNNVATFRSTGRQIDRTGIDAAIEHSSIDMMKDEAQLELESADAVRIDDVEIFSRQEILDASLDKEYASRKIVFADMSLLLKGKYYDIDKGILQVQQRLVSDKISRVKSSLATLILNSPGDGMILYKKNWRGGSVTVGASVWPGNTLMQLVDPSKTALRVYVPEKYSTGLETGQPATVVVDAFADRSYAGKVSGVSKLSRPISRQSPVKYFEATIALDASDAERLKPGMKGEAAIVVGKTEEDALIVPRAAIHGDGEETWAEVALRGGKTERRGVKLGAGDLVRVAVTSGLAEGDRVMLADESGAGAGAEEPATDKPMHEKGGKPGSGN